MAKDSMHSIIYKILKYVQACNLGHETFDERRIEPGSDLFPEVPYDYWASIISDLSNNGYLTGVIVTETKDEHPSVTIYEPRLTLAGEDYLSNNSTMKKVGETFNNVVGFLSSLKP